MSLKLHIARDLPNFPGDVIEQWLLPFAEDEGWPPDAVRWEYLLRITNMEFWKDMRWSHEQVQLWELNIESDTIDTISKMQRAYEYGEHNEYFRFLGNAGTKRFQSQFDYLVEHGVFPRSPVFVNYGQGFALVDGNHRLCAFESYRLKVVDGVIGFSPKEKLKRLNAEQSVWLGTIP